MNSLGPYTDHRCGYPLDESSTVIDVGGNMGDFTREMQERYGCRVLVYEPVPYLYDALVAEFGHDPKVSLRDEAVSDRYGERKFFLTGLHGDGTSPWRSGEPFFARTMDAAFLPPADLLKLNCEGGEYEILPRIDPMRFRFIQVQFHDGLVPDEQQRVADIRERLALTHDLMWRLGEWAGGFESWARR